MAFRSLAVAVFIVLTMALFNFPAYLNHDMGVRVWGEYHPARQLSNADTGMNSSFDSFKSQNLMDIPANDAEASGSSYGVGMGLTFIYNVAISSSAGFSDFWINFLQVDAGTGAFFLIDMFGWLINFNYALIVIQFLKTLGWAL